MNSQVDLALGVALQESVAVTAATPRVDLRSTEVNFNFSKEFIDSLPLERSYKGLLQLTPGVAENDVRAQRRRQPAGQHLPHRRREHHQPLFGYLSTEVNELDVAEVHIKRGAVSAESGRAGLRHERRHPQRLELAVRRRPARGDPERLGHRTATSGFRSTTSRLVPSVALGGPIKHDQIFFYGSAQATMIDTTDRSNNLGAGARPGEDLRLLRQDHRRRRPPSTSSARATARGRTRTSSPASAPTTPGSVATSKSKALNRVATATYSWFFSSTGYLDVKYLRLDEQNETVAIADLGFQPAFDVNNLAAMGQFTVGGVNVGGANLRLNRQNYSRDEVKASVSQYLDRKGMSHQLKAGFGVEGTKEDVTRDSNGWASISIVQAGRQVQARYYPRQPSQLSKSRTYSLFFQDNLTIGPRLVINAGVLFNQDDFRQELDSTNTFLTFGMGSQIQPRLGANYNLRKGAGDKVYGNYGRYDTADDKEQRALAGAEPPVHQ